MQEDNPLRFDFGSSRLLVVLMLVLWVSVAHSADWPQFRGPERDGKSPETGLLTQWPAEGLSALWVAKGLGEGYASAVIAGGMIITTGMLGEHKLGHLQAFDLEGKRLWSTPYGPEWEKTYPGSRYSPTIDGSRAYLISGHGLVCCFDTTSGTLLWKRDVANDFGGAAPAMGFAESLLVDGERLIVTPGGPDASVVALNKANGETIWTSKGLSDQSAYCSPILIERGGTRLIVTLVTTTLVGLDPETGAVVWRTPFDEHEELQNHAVAPVYADGLIYATSGHRKGGVMYALSADGKSIAQKWADETLNNHHGGVIFHDGHLYGSTMNGRWVCLSTADGTVKWEERGVGKGSVTFAEGHFYCYSEKGTLGLVKASSEVHMILSEFKVELGEGVHWAHPAIGGGKLYIRHGDVLIAYDVKTAT
jgi:outer membrane protein assembly factor BamB